MKPLHIFVDLIYCQLFTLSEVYYNLSVEERSRLQALEMFDEFEEFMLKANHYFVLVATKVGRPCRKRYFIQRVAHSDQTNMV